MYLTKHVIDTTDPKNKHFSDEQVLRHGSDKAHADYLWQKDTRGEMSVEWKHPRDGVLSRALVVYKIML